MRKEIITRISKVIIAMMFGILCFPYVDAIAAMYFAETGLFYGILLYIGFGIIALILYLLLRSIPHLKKLDNRNNVLGIFIDYFLNIIMLTAIVIVGLTIFPTFWVCVILLGFETIELVEASMKKVKN